MDGRPERARAKGEWKMARRKKVNEFPFVPIVAGTTFIALGAADNDAVTTVIMPGDGAISRSIVAGMANGTGTALVTMAWYTAAARAGTLLTSPHLSPAGTVYDQDASVGIVYTADGLTPFIAVPEGARLFLNCDFDGGTATGSPTFALAIWLVL